jgi:hypothetical protein
VRHSVTAACAAFRYGKPHEVRQRHKVRQEFRGSVAEGSAVCVNGETEPGGDSPTAHSLCPKVKLQVPPLRFAPVGMTNSRVAAHLGSGGGGGTESNNEGPHNCQKANLDKYDCSFPLTLDSSDALSGQHLWGTRALLLRQRHRDGQRLHIGRRRSGDQRIVASNRTGADVCVGAPTARGATDGYANQEDGRQDTHSQSALQSPPLPQEADAQHATR